ncbi:MAG: hypothetical protein H6625_01085 [Bdellovibrionaceae bacterium]|nr:hypothetical protein [Pseudobdellovibrionaceae bacterium]
MNKILHCSRRFLTVLLIGSLVFCFHGAKADNDSESQKIFYLIDNLNTNNFQTDLENIRECAKYPYKEVFSALLTRFNEEVQLASKNGLNVQSKIIIDEIIKAEGKIIYKNDSKYLNYLNQQATVLRNNLFAFITEKKWLSNALSNIFNAIKSGLNREGQMLTLFTGSDSNINAETDSNTNSSHYSDYDPKSVYMQGRLDLSRDVLKNGIKKPVLKEDFKEFLQLASDTIHENQFSLLIGIDTNNLSIEDPKFIEVLEEMTHLVGIPTELKQTFILVIDKLKKYHKELKAYNEYVNAQKSANDENNKNAKENLVLENINKYLKKYLIDQDEVIELIMDHEFRVAFRGLGEIQSPQIKYLIGEPGTGKDTAIETKVDAIHGYKGAHRLHMFRTPVAVQESDLWTLLGSPTGYVGSDSVPPFIEFLVRHSAGRYQFMAIKDDNPLLQSKTKYKIVENKDWRPGMVLDGYFPPESAEILVNERHNWSKNNTDLLLKQFLEDGYVTIRNPNGGLQEIYVPINITILSNEGMHLTTSKDEHGRRFGNSLTHDERMRRYYDIKDNKEVLRETIRKTNQMIISHNVNAPGISDETLNRIPDSAIIYMKPTSPESLKKIIRLKMDQLKKELLVVKGAWGPIELTWDESLIGFMQEFKYVAENNSRPADDRIASLVEATLYDAIRAGHITAEPLYGNKVHIKNIKNSDGTSSLRMKITPLDTQTPTKEVDVFIRATVSERDKQPISDNRLDELLQLPKILNSRVFGIEHITQRLTELAIAAEESLRANKSIDEAKDPAKIIAFFGMSSTGKSQTSKEFAKALKLPYLPLGFGQVQGKSDIKRMFFGEKLGDRVEPSIFMQHYDRNPDGMVVGLEELVNADNAEHVLNMIYDFFREAIISDFADGKPRAMGKIIFIINGNVGIEEFQKVAKDLPDHIKLEAYRNIHEEIMSSPNTRRAILERYMSAPLINRIDERNIFFFGPLGYQHVRSLSYLQMKEALESLKPVKENEKARRGWNVFFPSEKAFDEIIDKMEKEGFNVESQGASIVSIFNKEFVPHFRMTMYQHKIPSGTDLLVSLDKENTKVVTMGREKVSQIGFQVFVHGRSTPIRFSLRGKQLETELETPDIFRKLTGIHEAGHAIVDQYFLGEFKRHKGMSIMPGATRIGNEMVTYEGIANSEKLKKLNVTREYILREMATLFGGFMAQQLVTKGARHDAGKANDMKRATQLAKMAILTYGLEDEWGFETIEDSKKLDDYISNLSPSRREIFEKLKDKLMKEAQQLAKEALLVNLDTTLIPMGSELTNKGKILEGDMKKFLEKNPIINERDSLERVELLEDMEDMLKSVRQNVASRNEGRRRTKGLQKEDIDEALVLLKNEKSFTAKYSSELLKLYLKPVYVEALLSDLFDKTLQEELLPNVEVLVTKDVSNVHTFHEKEREKAIRQVRPQVQPPILDKIRGFKTAITKLEAQGISCEVALGQ